MGDRLTYRCLYLPPPASSLALVGHPGRVCHPPVSTHSFSAHHPPWRPAAPHLSHLCECRKICAALFEDDWNMDFFCPDAIKGWLFFFYLMMVVWSDFIYFFKFYFRNIFFYYKNSLWSFFNNYNTYIKKINYIDMIWVSFRNFLIMINLFKISDVYFNVFAE